MWLDVVSLQTDTELLCLWWKNNGSVVSAEKKRWVPRVESTNCQMDGDGYYRSYLHKSLLNGNQQHHPPPRLLTMVPHYPGLYWEDLVVNY